MDNPYSYGLPARIANKKDHTNLRYLRWLTELHYRSSSNKSREVSCWNKKLERDKIFTLIITRFSRHDAKCFNLKHKYILFILKQGFWLKHSLRLQKSKIFFYHVTTCIIISFCTIFNLSHKNFPLAFLLLSIDLRSGSAPPFPDELVTVPLPGLLSTVKRGWRWNIDIPWG